MDEEGRQNWNFFAEEENKFSKNSNFRLDNFNIINSTISYRNGKSRSFEEFSNITANIKAESSYGPFEVRGFLNAYTEPVDFDIISGKIIEARSFPLRIKVVLPGAEEGVSFAGTVVVDGPASALSGNILAKGLNAQGMVSSFQNIFQNKVAHPVNSARPFELKTKLIVTKARIELKPFFLKVAESVAEGEILYLPEEPVPNINATLKINTLKLDNWLTGIEQNNDFSISSRELPDYVGSIDINFGVIEYNDEIINRASVKGQFQNNKFEIERAQALLPGGSNIRVMGKADFKDQKNPKFNGEFRLSGNNLRKLLNWSGIDLRNIPTGQLTNFAIETGLKIEGNAFNFIRAKGHLDITKFNGDARIRLGGRTNYAINLGLSRLNLDNYFPINAKAEVKKNWSEIQSEYDDAFSPLKSFDGTFKIRSQQVIIKNALLKDFKIDATLTRGKLTLKTFSSSDAVGIKTHVSGTLEVGAKAPLLDLEVDLELGSIEKILKWTKITTKEDPFELGVITAKGRIATDLRRLTLNLEGQGFFGTYKTSGKIEGLSEDPESFDLAILFSHSDHTNLLKNLKVEIPFGALGSPLSINASANGSFRKLDGVIDAQVMGGVVHLEGFAEDVLNTPKVNMAVSIIHTDLVKAAQIFNINLTPSVEKIGGLKLNGNFKGSVIDYKLSNLNTQFGPTTITGEVKVNKEGSRPVIRGYLRLNKLPIDVFVGGSLTGAVEVQKVSGERWSKSKIETSFIRNWDANITLASGEVSFGRYKLERPRAEIKSANGIINISGLSGQTFGGTVAADITIDYTLTPKFLIDFNLRDARMESAAVAIADVRALTGLLNMSGHFESQGSSQFDIVSSLGGKGDLSVQNGVIRGVNLKLLSNGIAKFSKLSELDRVLGNSFGGGKTPYNVLTTRINVHSGLVETEGLNIALEGIDIDGGASFNLSRWSMESGGTIRLENDETAPPIGVELVGAIHKPDVNYQTDRLKDYVRERIEAKALELTLRGSLGTKAAVEIAPLDGSDEGTISTTPKEEVREDAIIKGLYDLINSRKKPVTKNKNKDKSKDKEKKDDLRGKEQDYSPLIT